MPNLQTLLNAIPTAQDGGPITIDYHNNMLAAVKGIASQIGASKTVYATFAPDLSANDGETPWFRSDGVAKKPTGATMASGWMGLQLPDGMRMDRLVVSGVKQGNLGSWVVRLERHPLAGGGNTLTALTLQDDPADPTTNIYTSQGSLPGNADPVDNSKYKYVVYTKIIGADAAATAELHSFQVICVQPSS